MFMNLPFCCLYLAELAGFGANATVRVLRDRKPLELRGFSIEQLQYTT